MKLAAVRSLALSLPEVAEQPHHQLTSFRVRGKIFATASPTGDFVHLFVADALREQALAMYPAFVEKLSWGGKVVGIRVLLPRAQADLVLDWVRLAWQHKAPRALQGLAPDRPAGRAR